MNPSPSGLHYPDVVGRSVNSSKLTFFLKTFISLSKYLFSSKIQNKPRVIMRLDLKCLGKYYIDIYIIHFFLFSLFSEHVLLYPLDVLRRQIQVRKMN